MKNQISKQQTIRFKDANLVERLNQDYLNSKFGSVNEYFNFCLENNLNSQINAKKELIEINNLLQEKNLSNKKFEQEQLYTLKEILRYLKKDMTVSIRTLALLTKYVFRYPLDEEELENGKYDIAPYDIQEFRSE